jgi:hypothetical protein
MDQVIIGVDPHKLSVRSRRGITGRSCGPQAGSALTPQLPPAAESRPAVAGAGLRTGSGARWRNGCWPTGSGCWTCPPSWPPGHVSPAPGRAARPMPTDAHAIVMVALGGKGLRELSTDPELMVLRMLRPP